MTRALHEGSLLWQVHSTTAALGVVQPLAARSGGGAVRSPRATPAFTRRHALATPRQLSLRSEATDLTRGCVRASPGLGEVRGFFQPG